MATPSPDNNRPMTDEEQARFAAHMRQWLPHDRGKDWSLYAFTDYARRMLKLPRLLHWRSLTVEQARKVMEAVKKEFPKQRLSRTEPLQPEA